MSDDIYIPPHKRIIDSSGETSPDGGGFNFVFYDRTKVRGGKKKKPIPPIGDAVSVNLSTDALEEIKEQQVSENPGIKIEDRIPDRDSQDQEASDFEGNVQKNDAVSLSLSTNALTEIREKRETESPDIENKEQKKTENEGSSHESGGGHINITV
ncbi:MAG: hypothetical protein A2017_07405 [Lentisphaerae bacterium GWF2_44_16]|nr:MAG: hypothetical protein A2017_07405 [Lentisphaerae bacterium GWF2_44_16]